MMKDLIKFPNQPLQSKNPFLSQWNVWWQPQLLSIIFVVIVLLIISIVVFFKTKKVKPGESPNTIAFLAEKYVNFIDDTFDELSGGNLEKPRPYFFALISFLFLGNIIGIFGLEAVSSSYSITLTLGIVSWIGIYVIGIVFQRIFFFRRYLFNPIEIVGQFTPLISISLRMFGNIIGGSVLLFLVYFGAKQLWGLIPIIGSFNLLGALLAPSLHLYFDIFSGLIQAYVFALLTLLYWTNQTQIPIWVQKILEKKEIKLKKRIIYAKEHEEG